MASSIADPSAWRGLVVYCAANAWAGNRYPDQHVAERLAAYAPVLYVDPPRSVLAPWREAGGERRLEMPQVQRIGPRLAHVTPIGPPAAGRRGIRALGERITRWTMRRALVELGCPEVHAVVAASFAPVFGVCGERRRVFYSTDDFVAGADLIKVSRQELLRHEARQLASVDTVIVCSPGLVERYRRLGAQPILVPNGCDDTLFAATDDAPPAGDVDLPAPVAGFVGHLTDRIDVALLDAVAAAGGPRSCSSVALHPPSTWIASPRCWLDRTCAGWGRSRSRSCRPTCGPSTSGCCRTPTPTSTVGASRSSCSSTSRPDVVQCPPISLPCDGWTVI